MRSLLLIALLAAQVGAESGRDLDNAFPAFTTGGKKSIPVDFQYVSLYLEFDPAARKAVGTCSIEFFAREEGYPVIDLVPEAISTRLNNVDLGKTGLSTISAPANATTLRRVEASVPEMSHNLLEIEYELDTNTVGFSPNGIRMVWAMSDVGSDREFLEKYACSNLEFDRFTLHLKLEIAGNPTAHQVFTNGALSKSGNRLWKVDFPSHFTTSSFFFHITDRAFAVETDKFPGVEKEIPIVVYANSQSSARQGVNRSKQVLAELEKTYGAYDHDSLVVYLTAGGGGMEHAGATITSLGALDHEITHSWFARGLMPADGNAGWIDEAIASWRDNGYPKLPANLSGSSANLASFSAYRRTTPQAAYTYGAQFMARLDSLFSSGLRAQLKEIYRQAKRQPISTPEFQALLETVTKKTLQDYFDAYVFGESAALTFVPSPNLPDPFFVSHHPPPLTQKEIEALR